MRAQTAILFFNDSVRFQTTAMGSSVQTTSAKTETAVRDGQRRLVDMNFECEHTRLQIDGVDPNIGIPTLVVLTGPISRDGIAFSQ